MRTSPLEGFRPCAAMAVLNNADLVLMARRTGLRSATAWQFPQGGIDGGETPREACLRELAEEVGLNCRDVEIAACAKRWLKYVYPPDIAAKISGPGNRGQVQAWFLLRLKGLAKPDFGRAKAAEFDMLRWSTLATAAAQIIPFKRQVYRSALAEFTPERLASCEEREILGCRPEIPRE